MIRKFVKNKSIILIGVLLLNLGFLLAYDLIKYYFKLNLPQVNINENIMNKIFFYSFIFILIGPILEELLYRLPLKKNKYSYLSLFVGVIYVIIFDFLPIRIMLGLYLASIIYLQLTKRKIPNLFIFFSILMFTISHIGNYNIIDLKLMNTAGLIFLFLPQLVVGIITSVFRLKFSFKYAIFYHSIYNLIVILLAIIIE